MKDFFFESVRVSGGSPELGKETRVGSLQLEFEEVWRVEFNLLRQLLKLPGHGQFIKVGMVQERHESKN